VQSLPALERSLAATMAPSQAPSSSPPASPSAAPNAQLLVPRMLSLMHHLSRIVAASSHPPCTPLALTLLLGLITAVTAPPQRGSSARALSPVKLAAAVPLEGLFHELQRVLEPLPASDATLHERLVADARPSLVLAILQQLCACGAATAGAPSGPLIQALLGVAGACAAVHEPGPRAPQPPVPSRPSSSVSTGTVVAISHEKTTPADAAVLAAQRMLRDADQSDTEQWQRPELAELGAIRPDQQPYGYLPGGARSRGAQLRHDALAALAVVLEEPGTAEESVVAVLLAERERLFEPLRRLAALHAPNAGAPTSANVMMIVSCGTSLK
jgi:hypothetical protein